MVNQIKENMISNTQRIWAVFSDDNGSRTYFRVVAWDDDGDAYIIGDKGLRLANGYKNYEGLSEEGPDDDEYRTITSDELDSISHSLNEIVSILKDRYAINS
jgi:hypothetical protein